MFQPSRRARRAGRRARAPGSAPSPRSNQIERSPSVAACQRRSTGRPEHAAVERLHRREIAHLDRDVVDAVRRGARRSLMPCAPILTICFHSRGGHRLHRQPAPAAEQHHLRERARGAQLGQRHLARELALELMSTAYQRGSSRELSRIVVPVARIELRRVGVAGADDARRAGDRRRARRSSDRRARRRRRRSRRAACCGPGSCAPRPSGWSRPWRAPDRRWRTRRARTSSASSAAWPRFLPPAASRCSRETR